MSMSGNTTGSAGLASHDTREMKLALVETPIAARPRSLMR